MSIQNNNQDEGQPMYADLTQLEGSVWYNYDYDVEILVPNSIKNFYEQEELFLERLTHYCYCEYDRPIERDDWMVAGEYYIDEDGKLKFDLWLGEYPYNRADSSEYERQYEEGEWQPLFYPNPEIVLEDTEKRAAIIIQRAFRKYQVKRFESSIVIQRAFRKTRYTPGYELCKRVVIGNVLALGGSFIN